LLKKVKQRLHPNGFHFPFAFSPISISRRMASERPGESSSLAAHVSTAVRISFDSRMAVTGSWPVAGRPGRFRTTFFVDSFIENVLRLSCLKDKRPADVFEHVNGPNPNPGVDATEQIAGRLDSKAVKEYLGESYRRFEIAVISTVIRIKTVQRFASAT